MATTDPSIPRAAPRASLKDVHPRQLLHKGWETGDIQHPPGEQGAASGKWIVFGIKDIPSNGEASPQI